MPFTTSTRPPGVTSSRISSLDIAIPHALPARFALLGSLLIGGLACAEQARAPSEAAEAAGADTPSGTPVCAAAGPAGGPLSDSTTVGLTDSPCDIRTVPVTVLRASEDGSRPDPGSSVVMASDGRFVTTSRYTTAILEWSPDGEFVQSVGREGEGPGEFSPRGALVLFMGPADSVFVLDGAQRWSVFAPDLTFVRSFTGERTGRGRGGVHVVDGRGILTTGRPFVSSADRQFVMTTFDGTTSRAFGPSSESSQRYTRMSAPDDDGVWVLPESGTRGIVLERWSFDGEKLASLEYDAPWLPIDGYPDSDIQGEPDLPDFDAVHLDPDGLLWVPVGARDPRWRAIDGPERADVAGELYDGRLVVINPRSAEVVASLRIDSPFDQAPPFERFISGRRAYRTTVDSIGNESLEIVDVYLVDGG